MEAKEKNLETAGLEYSLGRAEETEPPDKPGPCSAVQSRLFPLLPSRRVAWVPTPQSKCWAGSGGQLEPPRKHLHIPDAYGQRRGPVPGPSLAPPPRCWPPHWKQSLRMSSGGAACTCYVTCSSQSSSCLLPLTGPRSGWQASPSPSRAQDSPPPPPVLLAPENAASVGPAAVS